ncbi:hypothetical protein [Flexivirga oryzae]|uniref:Uncharacterized protein n=1 Tax=Flexivirga oryzae TaxID=1794944 RepID=A0A839MYN5_9MICO|nr:hypothetical protein [Flexivirga oryzae]MBB2890277.1 hypothetical protein [Flexivirga oryzae]
MSSDDAWRDMNSATSPAEYTQAKNDYYLAKNTEDGWAQVQARSGSTSGSAWDSVGGFTSAPGTSGGGFVARSGPVARYRWSSLWHTTVDVSRDVRTAFHHETAVGWVLAPFQFVWYMAIGALRIAGAILRLVLAVCGVVLRVVLVLIGLAIVAGIGYAIWTWFHQR